MKLLCHQEWELKGFTQRRSGREAGELALMWSQWEERGVDCPESGSTLQPIQIKAHTLYIPVSSHIILIYRDVSSSSHGRREYTVGQYVVDVPSFENLALPLFRNVRQLHIFKLIRIDHSKQGTLTSCHSTNH